MLDKLPNELLLEISKNLSLHHISKLKFINKTIYHNIISIENHIINDKLAITKTKTKQEIITYLIIFLNQKYYKLKCDYLSYLSFTIDKNTEVINLNTGVKDSINLYNISKNVILNKIFRRIMKYFLQNKSMTDYTYQIELILFYHLIKIVYNKTSININYYMDFITDFNNHNNTNFNDIFVDYTDYIIKNITNENTVSFDVLYKLSSFSSNIQILKKILCYKVLNLNNTKLHEIDDMEIRNECIGNLVIFKYNNRHDGVITHNYHQIKMLLRKSSQKSYETLCKYEDALINRSITIYDPYTSTKIHITSKEYCKLRRKLASDNMKRSLNKIILSQRQHYKRLYFN